MKSHTFRGKRYKIMLDYVMQGFVHDGSTRDSSRYIYIAANLQPKEHLRVALHEAMHAENPEMSEQMVESQSSEMANFLWRLGYRRG